MGAESKAQEEKAKQDALRLEAQRQAESKAQEEKAKLRLEIEKLEKEEKQRKAELEEERKEKQRERDKAEATKKQTDELNKTLGKYGFYMDCRIKAKGNVVWTSNGEKVCDA